LESANKKGLKYFLVPNVEMEAPTPVVVRGKNYIRYDGKNYTFDSKPFNKLMNQLRKRDVKPFDSFRFGGYVYALNPVLSGKGSRDPLVQFDTKLNGQLTKKSSDRLKKLNDTWAGKLDSYLALRYVATGDGEADIRSIWRELSGKGNTFRLIISNKEDKEITYYESNADYKRMFRSQFKVGGVYDGDNIFTTGDVMLFVKPSQIEARKFVQKFREGVEVCVFVPIKKKLMKIVEESGSDSTKKRNKQRLNAMIEMEKMYDGGVPEEEMEVVAKKCGLKVVLNDIIGDKMNCFNENGKLGCIKITNTRDNHVDEGCMVVDGDYETVSRERMDSLWLKHKERKDYLVEGDFVNDKIDKLCVLGGAYKVENPENDIMNEFDKKADTMKYKINATAYPELNEFIKAGRIINSWATEVNDNTPTGHIDMPKAYAQFKKCDYYRGFLGMIHTWRNGVFDRSFIEKHIGMYQFIVKECSNRLLKKFGIDFGTVHILPSPEILYMMDNGLKCDIVAGAFGSKFDFEFSDEMLENRRYCIWSGRLGREKTHKSYSFYGSRERACGLKYDKPDCDVLYWEDKGLITIKKPINNVYTRHHILAFITSYVRIQMLQTMSKFPFENLCKVVLDGIYYSGEKPSGVEWFVEKEMKEHVALDKWYDGCSKKFGFNKLTFSENTFIGGQGGAGKTYSLLTDKCWNRPLFVVPQHVLGQRAAKQYGVHYTTINQLIGMECQPFKDKFYYPAMIIIDETTQIDASWIKKALNMYPESLIVLIGDIDKDGVWYQTRNGKPGEYSKVFNPSGMNYVYVEGDRRSKDDKLKEFKLSMRKYMKGLFVNGDSGEEFDMKCWVNKNAECIKFDNAVKMFESGDTWIAGTHETNKKLLDNGIVSGYYKKGGFVSDVELEGYEKRGAFTCHSYQGSTISEGKVFITMGDMFEWTMLYTAVSRAVSFDQLVFVV